MDPHASDAPDTAVLAAAPRATPVAAPAFARLASLDAEAAEPWRALARLLGCVDAVRDGPAWFLLLSIFALAGMLLAMAEASFAREQLPWAVLQSAAAFFVVFYGGNAGGMLTMDRVLRRGMGTPMGVGQAVRLSLLRAHHLVGVLLLVVACATAAGAALLGLLWLCRAPWVGPLLFALLVPVGVVAVGLSALAGALLVVPLSAPAIWAGASAWQAVRQLAELARQRLMLAAVMIAGLSLLTGLAGAATSFMVWFGGRVVAEAAVRVIQVKVPPELLMAGLFGHGLRSINAQAVPPEAVSHTAAALVGGGVVFALALVLPGLVYLRGVCTAFVALRESLQDGVRR